MTKKGKNITKWLQQKATVYRFTKALTQIVKLCNYFLS